MAKARALDRRRKSIRNIRKITRTMELISTARFKRAMDRAIAARAFAQRITALVGRLIRSGVELSHPLLQPRPETARALLLVLTANRGLCGGFNTNVIKTMLEILREKNEANEIVLTVGKKGRQSMERIGKKVLADFEKLGDKPSYLETLGISKVVLDDFMAGKLDEVYMVYNHFYSTMTQKPAVIKLLPLDLSKDLAKPKLKRDYIFEPDREKLLNELLMRYVETIVYQTVLESVASEHSARMMAMRQASDNANEIVSTLTLHYNKARQAKITTGILEVVAGS